MKRLKQFWIFAVLIMLLIACGTNSQLEPEPGLTNPTLSARQIAEQHLSEVSGTDMAPGWDNAALGEKVRAFYRPDMETPAYYEFEVEPEGFIVVATGEHDFPVPHWDFEGESLGHMLEQEAAERGQQITRFLKLDVISYAAENSAQELISHLGGLPQSLANYEDLSSSEAKVAWTAFQENYQTDYAGDLEAIQQRANAVWQAAANANLGPQGATAWKYGWAGGTNKSNAADQQPEYGQFKRGNGNDCKSGCAPTAWAILFSWADRQAARGIARWRNSKGIYRFNGSKNGADRTAPLSRNNGVNSMIWELYGHMGTKCVSLSHDGLTFPWNMTKANKYLEPRSGARVSAEWTVRDANPIWDATKGKSLISKTKNSIVNLDTPVVAGVKTNIYTYHYAVAYGYRWRLHQTCTPIGCQTWWTEGQIYLNWGWGEAQNERRGDKGWISDHIWFVGELAPSGRADTFPSPTNPNPPPPPTCSRSWPTVKPSSGYNKYAKAIQYLLKARGYSLEADGHFGSITETAVKSFQRSRGLFASGEVDKNTFEQLVITVSKGSKGNAVRAAQFLLGGLTVDGDFGSRTDTAVRNFQSSKGLGVDGDVGKNTWAALFGGRGCR